MKKIFALLLAVIMLVTVLAACGGGDTAPPPAQGEAPPAATNDTPDAPPAVDDTPRAGGTINVWSFTDEIPNAFLRFREMNPDFPYDINVTVVATDGGGYQQALDQALIAGGSDAPDIFTAESAFVLKYSQYDAAHLAMPFSELLGQDVAPMISAAQLAPYTVELGTRTSDGEVVALPFQMTGSGFIYRRSLAEAIWGNDDPDFVGTKIGPGYDQFLVAANEAAAQGIAILAGEGDAWQAIRSSATTPWIVNDRLQICATRDSYLDVGYELYNNNYTTKADAWGDAWFAGFSGASSMPVLGYMGPAWLISYVMSGNAGDTFGDWAITHAPVPFTWGGTWVFANAGSDDSKRAGIATLVEWMTLDYSETGLQQFFANGNLFEGSAAFPGEAADYAAGSIFKDAVNSGVVLGRSDGTLEFLGWQNMNDIFVPAGATASGRGFGPYDETINQAFNDQALQYFMGEKSREDAIADFKQYIQDTLDIPS